MKNKEKITNYGNLFFKFFMKKSFRKKKMTNLWRTWPRGLALRHTCSKISSTPCRPWCSPHPADNLVAPDSRSAAWTLGTCRAANFLMGPPPHRYHCHCRRHRSLQKPPSTPLLGCRVHFADDHAHVLSFPHSQHRRNECICQSWPSSAAGLEPHPWPWAWWRCLGSWPRPHRFSPRRRQHLLF